MEIKIHLEDKMTPLERQRALEQGEAVDRVPAIPFMSEIKCKVSGVSIWDFWHDAKKMAETEIAVFNRYGQDRMTIGPNSRGITEALGGESVYPKDGVPYMEKIFLTDYGKLDGMEPVDAKTHPRMRTFAQAGELLMEQAGEIVPIEASIGGPFTIAANLRGAELLLRDCRKNPEEVHRLMRIITDSQKSWIDEAARIGVGTAMADPVANPALIGPKLYENFVFPYTKELTDYVLARSGKRVSLHMCGKTNSIWKYLCQYELNELSLDNIIDLRQAVKELGDKITLAGNVDPVEIVLNGTREDMWEAVQFCITEGMKSEKGFHLATGCDIPEITPLYKIDWFMEAAREANYKIIF